MTRSTHEDQNRVLKRAGYGCLVMVLLILACLISMIHVVWNVPNVGTAVFWKRSPNLQDTFVNFQSLEAMPDAVLRAKHPSVTRALEHAYYLHPTTSAPSPEASESPAAKPTWGWQGDVPIPDLALRDCQLHEGRNGTVYLLGKVHNNARKPVKMLSLTFDVIGKDQERYPGEASDYHMRPLAPGQDWTFRTSDFRADTRSYELKGITGQF